MTEKDLDIAIEKCERIMEMDTRTMQNPVSDNGHIFEKVYELLKFLRQLQFATDTNVGGTNDTISRQTVLDAVDGVTWYHQNKHGEMVSGANDDEHQAWYKVEDIYKAIESVQSAQPDHIGEVTEMIGDLISRAEALDTLNGIKITRNANWYEFYQKALTEVGKLPSAQPVAKDINVPVKDCISRQWLMECVDEGWIKFDTQEDENRFVHLIRDIAPSAQSTMGQVNQGETVNERAVKFLDLFAKTYCRDKSVTDDLKFRCSECEFEMPDKKCLVKCMARKLFPDYKDFGSMGDL